MGESEIGQSGSGSEGYAFKPFILKECSIFGNQNREEVNRDAFLEPVRRIHHRLVCDQGNLYSFGGYGRTSAAEVLQYGFLQELLCYNMAESRWTQLPNLGNVLQKKQLAEVGMDAPIPMQPFPEPCMPDAAVLFGSHLVIFGDSAADRLIFSTCDLRTLEWNTGITNGPRPPCRSSQTVCMDAETNSLYFVGGISTEDLMGGGNYNYSMDIHKFDWKTATWEALYLTENDTRGPKGRLGLRIAFYGDTIYLLGGIENYSDGSGKLIDRLDEIWAFNVKTRSWDVVETIASGEVYPLASIYSRLHVQFEDCLFMSGRPGKSFDFNNLCKFHFPTLTWTIFSFMELPPYFCDLSFSSCVTNAGCLYISSSWEDRKNGSGTSEQSNTIVKMWLKVPSLQEMAWEAVLHYRKDIGFKSRSELRELGIPKEFSDRVHPCAPSGPDSKSLSEHWANNSLAAFNATNHVKKEIEKSNL